MQEKIYSESEEKIFFAALEVFSREGKKGARLQEIADRAGMNKALIHYYFRSKDRLYEEVFSFVIRRFFMRLSTAMQADGPFEVMVHNFIDRYVDMLNENPALTLFILRDLSEGAPVMGEKLREVMIPSGKSVPEVFITRFNEARAEGRIRDVDASQTLITLMGACIYFFAGYPALSAILPDIRDRRDEFLEERKQHIFDILFNGIKSRPELSS